MSKGYQVVVAHDGWVGSRWSARLPYPQAQTGNRGDRRMGQGEHSTRGNCGKKRKLIQTVAIQVVWVGSAISPSLNCLQEM